MTIVLADRAVETSDTQGSVDDFELEGAVVNPAAEFGYQTFLAAVGDQTGTGNVTLYGVQQVGDDNWEIYTGELQAGAGAGGKDVLTRGTLKKSSTGGRIAWGSGSRSVFGTLAAVAILMADNNLSDLTNVSDARDNLGLGAAAVLDVGADDDAKLLNRAQLDVRYQAAGSYAAAAHDHDRVVLSGQTGGTVGRVVRPSGTANTWTDAVNSDTMTQLAQVAFLEASGVYVVTGAVSGFTSLTPGDPYFLGSASTSRSTQVVSTAPTPGAGTRRLPLGVALSASTIDFNPGLLVGGT